MVTGEVAEVPGVATVKPPEYTEELPDVTSSIVPPAATWLRAEVRVQASTASRQVPVPSAVGAAAYSVNPLADTEGASTTVVAVTAAVDSPTMTAAVVSRNPQRIGRRAWVGVRMGVPPGVMASNRQRHARLVTLGGNGAKRNRRK
jgi:hypothetical protein